MEPYDPLWFEEPCPPRNFREMGEIARETSIPIATGERLVSPHEFQNLFAEGACAFAQPDLGSAGGITACKKIATLAEVNYVLMAPHIGEGRSSPLRLSKSAPMFRTSSFRKAFINRPVSSTKSFRTFCLGSRRFPAHRSTGHRLQFGRRSRLATVSEGRISLWTCGRWCFSPNRPARSL